MKCKFCKYNSIAFCGKGIFPDDYFYKYQAEGEIGCSSGSPFPEQNSEYQVITKDEILKNIQAAIDKYNELNMIVDVMYWANIRNQIKVFLI